MDSSKVAKNGTLEALSIRDPENLRWMSKFFVLYKKSESNRARLDWFTNEQEFNNSPGSHKTIYIEEIDKIRKYKDDTKENTFEIRTSRREKPFRYAAVSKPVMSEWINSIEKLMKAESVIRSTKRPKPGNMGEDVYINEVMVVDEDSLDFMVTVQETELSKKCTLTGDYVLRLYSKYLAIAHPKMKEENLYYWNYSHLRRYGHSAKLFTFEPGRKSGSGEGVCSFLTEAGAEIQRVINSNVKRSSACTVAKTASETATPGLPTRQYSQSYTEVVQHLNAAKPGRQGPPVPGKRSSNDCLPPVPTNSAPKEGSPRMGEAGKPGSKLMGAAAAAATAPPLRDLNKEDAGTYSEALIGRPPVVNMEYDEAMTYVDAELPQNAPVAARQEKPQKMSAIVAQINAKQMEGQEEVGEDYSEYYDQIAWSKAKSRPAQGDNSGDEDYGEINEDTYSEVR